MFDFVGLSYEKRIKYHRYGSPTAVKLRDLEMLVTEFMMVFCDKTGSPLFCLL